MTTDQNTALADELQQAVYGGIGGEVSFKALAWKHRDRILSALRPSPGAEKGERQ